jgi:hypothetical protein
MTPHQFIVLVLMQREHLRLEEHAKQLRSHTLNLNDLYTLRQHWQECLGFPQARPLRASLTYLIQQQENGNCLEVAYTDTLKQITLYRYRTRRWVIHQFGCMMPYLVPGGRLKPAYEQTFQRIIESRKPLSTLEQGTLLRRLYLYRLKTPPHEFDPLAGTHLPYDDTTQVH